MNILKQKLLDIYYLAEDSEELHGVTDCYNKYHDCDNLASIYCENNLCKLCCEVILILIRNRLIKNSVLFMMILLITIERSKICLI